MGWDQGLGLGVKREEINGVGSGQVLMNPYMVGNPVQVGNGRAAFETSKELSSIPKMVVMMQQHEPTRCDYCVKVCF
ncbi:hypothetical protein K8353_49355, partial [Burkholderia contaminans]|nr:hypothetical protein [Burkholderia contaminans]